MPHETGPANMPKMPERYTIRKLNDGTFILEESGDKGMAEYSYESVDELLADLKADLGSDESKEKSEEPEHKKKAKKTTDQMTEDDYE